MSVSKEQMDQLIEQHFQFEARGDVDGVLQTLAPELEHDVVGFPLGPQSTRGAVAQFYQRLYADLAHTGHRPLRRFYGDGWVVDETLWEGRAVGRPFGLSGKGRPVSFR